MTDRALPYYKWFWQDWRSNRTIQRMGYVERGLYRELLDECWAEGCIPDDVSAMAEICGCPEQVMADAWQVLSKCFVLLDGKWHNEKLDSLRTEQDQIRVKRANAGAKGGKSKLLNEKENEANAKQMLASASNCHIEEKRREENISSSGDDSEADKWCSLDEVVAVYHDLLPMLPSVRMMNGKRKSLLKTRQREYAKCREADWWHVFFDRASQSRFLTGQSNNNTWQADFDFLLSPKGFTGVIEGKYK